MEISTFKIIESAAKRRRETEACMNVTEKMHRIQLAANAWYAPPACTGCSSAGNEFDEDDDGTDRERPR